MEVPEAFEDNVKAILNNFVKTHEYHTSSTHFIRELTKHNIQSSEPVYWLEI